MHALLCLHGKETWQEAEKIGAQDGRRLLAAKLGDATHVLVPPSWSKDGRAVAFTTLGPLNTQANPAAAPSPLAPGEGEWGDGGLGAHRVVTQGRTTLDLAIYARDTYDTETMRTILKVSDPGTIIAKVHVDFGDGTSFDHVHSCANTTSADPAYDEMPYHRYAAPGDYKVHATLTTLRCGNTSDDQAGSDPNTTDAEVVEHVHAGARPHP
jgi:hypothetical protein